MTINILIVDDTPENLHLLAAILTERGYKVRLAPSGAHALQSVQKNQPDLILLDIMMPNMDGYEVCRALKVAEPTRDLPVIFISALDDIFDKMTAFSVGGVDYITKPFQEAEVLARVKTHLTIRQLQQELEQKNQALHNLNVSLEEKVQARTTQLAQANQALTAEIEQRIRHQEEKERLFNLVSQQSEQLRSMTNWLIETQQQERQGLSANLHKEIQQKVSLLQAELSVVQNLLLTGDLALISGHLDQGQLILAQMSRFVESITLTLHQATAHTQDLSQGPLLKLTSREREVLKLVAGGKNTPEIAAILTVTPSTVHTYNKRIREKLDIHDLAGLVKFALAHQL